MRAIVVVAVLVFGLALGFAVQSWVDASTALFEAPPAPLPEAQSQTYPVFDLQIHSRGMDGTMEQVEAQHGTDCAAPPATHLVTGAQRAASAYVCSGHVMTVLHEGGYGAIAITPTQQIVGTSATVTWDMSTETQSNRDWVDVWITPWADNLTEPADIGAVDLQGEPRNAIQVRLAMDFNHAWCVSTIKNGVKTGYTNCDSGASPNIHAGITPGTNEAAVRQKYRIIAGPTTLRFERLASATATGIVYYDGPAMMPNIDGAVVQFEHHSYNPEKDGSCDAYVNATGRPCGPTWHWNNMECSPCVPFTLLRPNITEIQKIGRDPTLTTITFPPAPAGAMLRFTALGGITLNGALAPKQANTNGAFLASPYFLPLAQGATSVTLGFAPDGSYDLGFTMSIQDIAVWAQGAPAPTTPTPVPPTPAPPTITPVPPTATNTPLPPTATVVVPPNATPNPKTYRCYEVVPGGGGPNGVNNDVLLWTRVGGGACP